MNTNTSEQFFILALIANNLIIGISTDNLPALDLTIKMPANGTITVNGALSSTSPIPGITITKTLGKNQFELDGDFTANGLLIAQDITATITGSVNLIYKELTFGSAEEYGKILLFLEKTTAVTISGSLNCDREKNDCWVAIESTLSADSITINNILGLVKFGADCDMTINKDITTNNNTLSFPNPDITAGVIFETGAMVKTNGIFTITIADNILQKFDSSAVEITKTDGTTSLDFSDFAVTVGGTTYGMYASIPANRVLLNDENQL